MILASQLKTGQAIALDSVLYVILEFTHVKPGKGGAFVRLKLKDMKGDRVLDRTLRAGERVQDVFLDKKAMQFMYFDAAGYHFMDQETFEQLMLPKEVVKGILEYLKDGVLYNAVFCEGALISIEPPVFMDLEVVHTDPGLKGDTAKGGTKPAEVETGSVIQVPLFIDVGDVLKVDTRTGQYVERAK